MPVQTIVPQSGAARRGRRPVRIGKYKVVEHIATGGMGAVYRAIDVELDRPVALKVLAPDLAAKPIALERFRREARSAARLRHANVVTVFDCGEDNGVHYLALEFVDGIDMLDHITKKGKLEVEEARQILIQAARALQHAHKQGMVHRDIKPSNFLIVNKNGKLRVKLTDMGLARLVRDDSFRLTEAGTTLGTVDYMSPEQARDGNSADIRSDIYSLGCTFFHMLSGAAPFARGTLAERLTQHFETRPPDIRSLNQTVPEGLALVLARMLEKKPADRYQTPTELLQDLENPERVVPRLDSSERRTVLEKLADGDEPSQVGPVTRIHRQTTVNKPPRKSRLASATRSPAMIPLGAQAKEFRDPLPDPKPPVKPPLAAVTAEKLSRFARDNWLPLVSAIGVALGALLVLIQLFSGR